MHIPYRLFRKPPRPMNDATPPAAAHDPLSRQEAMASEDIAAQIRSLKTPADKD